MITASGRNILLTRIRSGSAYPIFRKFIDIFTVAGYILSGALLLAAVAALAGKEDGSLAFLVEAIACGLLVAVIREISQMVADIADTTIQAAYRELNASAPDAATATAEPITSPTACAIDVSGRRKSKTARSPCDTSRIPIVLVTTGLALFFLVIAAGIYAALIR